jgi:hypothetical protein
VHLLDEVPQHSLGDVEVRDHAVLEGAHRHDVARSAADHPFSLDPDRHDLPVVGVERHHAWLVEDDPPAAHVHQGVGGTEVDGHVAAKKRQRIAHRERAPSDQARIFARAFATHMQRTFCELSVRPLMPPLSRFLASGLVLS